MHLILYIIITILGVSSYIVGTKEMLQGKYSPSTFSRIIWVLLAINSFAGVILSKSSTSSIILGGILLLGNIIICIISFWKGTREIGTLEYTCLILLLISAIIWIFFRAPLINLIISLIGHLIAGAPTYRKVIKTPKSESSGFWSLFFLASLLSVFASPIFSLRTIILPLYFTLFDGSIFFLSLKKRG
jgi:hypothetical protein